jgi:SNF2 family DNA or RNA helicase
LAYSFKSDLARIKAAFPSAVELSTAAGMKAFRSGNAPIGLAHPKSMGHGIDGLQNVSNILVRFGHGWNLGEQMQMLERIGPMRQLQAGLDRAVFVYHIIAEDTLDETVIESHKSKTTVQQALLNAMKRRFNGTD